MIQVGSRLNKKQSFIERLDQGHLYPMPEFIDPVFTKTSPIRSFSVIQNERFGLVFAKTGSIILGTSQGLRIWLQDSARSFLEMFKYGIREFEADLG